MGESRRVLVVHSNLRSRPELDTLLRFYSRQEFDASVLLTEECHDSIEHKQHIDYHTFSAVYIPGIRYTIPGLSFVKKFRRLATRADVVHVIDYDFLPSLIATLLSCRSENTVVLTVDALTGVTWSYGNRFVDGIASVYTNTLGRLMFRCADELVSISESIRPGLERLSNSDNVRVIPNGVNTEVFCPDDGRVSIKSGETVDLLFVGRLELVKDIPTLLESVKILHERATKYEFKLTIVGDGTKRQRLRALCREYGIEEIVRFEGWQSDVAEYYQESDIFVLSSRSESQAVVRLEAQACGLPVVTTDVGDARTVVGAGRIVPVGDADALAEAILDVANQNPSELSTLARNHVVENFSESEAFEQLEDLYRDLFDSVPRSCDPTGSDR